MGKKYSIKTTKKYNFRISPKDAQNIIRGEFVDKNNYKHTLNVNFTPHLPNKGDMSISYKK